MLISAPLPTRYPKICSQRPFSAAMCSRVNWWRKRNHKSNRLTTWQVSIHADLYKTLVLFRIDYLCTDGECRTTLSWVPGNAVNSKLKPVILHCNLVSVYVVSLTPLLSLLLISARLSTRNFIVRTWNSLTAMCRAVRWEERLKQSLGE